MPWLARRRLRSVGDCQAINQRRQHQRRLFTFSHFRFRRHAYRQTTTTTTTTTVALQSRILAGKEPRVDEQPRAAGTDCISNRVKPGQQRANKQDIYLSVSLIVCPGTVGAARKVGAGRGGRATSDDELRRLQADRESHRQSKGQVLNSYTTSI